METTKINGISYAVLAKTTIEEVAAKTPLAAVNMAANGWRGMAIIRRLNGRKESVAMYNDIQWVLAY